ncbi:proline-rich proteoglycan 2-like [Corvus kubaryi]|uniref:proline-rich proteoglycan 2-like n=1 Tax=Corvus kubaryi TaxID=68294 RepID=UPI001C04F2BA|nr:proline-rich proteoglycan 2-like [Corvus kubaryi]
MHLHTREDYLPKQLTHNNCELRLVSINCTNPKGRLQSVPETAGKQERQERHPPPCSAGPAQGRVPAPQSGCTERERRVPVSRKEEGARSVPACPRPLPAAPAVPPVPAAPQPRCPTQHLRPPSPAWYLRPPAPLFRRPRSPPAVPTGPARRRRPRATPSCLGPAGGMASLRDVTCARPANRERWAVMSSQREGAGRRRSHASSSRGGAGLGRVRVVAVSLFLSLSPAFASR